MKKNFFFNPTGDSTSPSKRLLGLALRWYPGSVWGGGIFGGWELWLWWCGWDTAGWWYCWWWWGVMLFGLWLGLLLWRFFFFLVSRSFFSLSSRCRMRMSWTLRCCRLKTTGGRRVRYGGVKEKIKEGMREEMVDSKHKMDWIHVGLSSTFEWSSFVLSVYGREKKLLFFYFFFPSWNTFLLFERPDTPCPGILWVGECYIHSSLCVGWTNSVLLHCPLISHLIIFGHGCDCRHFSSLAQLQIRVSVKNGGHTHTHIQNFCVCVWLNSPGTHTIDVWTLCLCWDILSDP